MSSQERPVWFYIPKAAWTDGLSPSGGYGWGNGNISGGVFNWIFQTYQYLKDRGCHVVLCDDLSQAGVLIAHRDSIPLDYKPGLDQFLVCVMADRPRHPFAHFHILQNAQLNHLWPARLTHRFDRLLFGEAMHDYMHHWPQPNMRVRDHRRGEKIENVAYFGVPENLHPGLRDGRFVRRLSELGFHWNPCFDPAKWTDYTYTDVIVAIRPNSDNIQSCKPPTKLMNCWLAGVVPILGSETAYQGIGDPGTDYLEADNPDAVIDWLVRLRANPGKVQSLLVLGRARGADLSRDNLCRDWTHMMHRVERLQQRWMSMPAWKQFLFYVNRTRGVVCYLIMLRLFKILGRRYRNYL